MTKERWLAIVGLGEDGIDGLPPAARALVAQAGLVVGGKRHLALVEPLRAETFAWPSPIEDALDTIEAWRGRPVCVLASGDPFFFGVGTMLMRRFSPAEILCLPAPSAFALAAARLGWSEQDCAMVSLHGRSLEAIVPRLQPGARILALSWDGTTPAKLAALLAARRMGRSKLTVCEAMGGPSERVRTGEAEGFALGDVAALNTIALEVAADRGARIVPRAPGLPDDWFEHDGQITKRDVRAITLSALAPQRGELLWDVGAGSGSVAIEWMLADSANRAIAIESRADRAARVARNALALGAPSLSVVTGKAPHALDGPARAGRDLRRRRRNGARTDRPGGRCASTRRPPRGQRGHAGNAGGRGRVARKLGRGACADRHRARRAGRALLRLARGDAGRSMALDETMSGRAAKGYVAIGVGCRAGVSGAAIAALARARPRRIRRAGGRAAPVHPRRQGRGAGARRGGAADRRDADCPADRSAASRGGARPDAFADRPGPLRRAGHRRGCRPRGRGRGRKTARAAARRRRRNLRRRAFRGVFMTVHFIGAGPGAPDLITVRGRDLVARCPVCLYAGSLVPKRAAGLLPTGRDHRRHRAARSRPDRGAVRRSDRRRQGRGAAPFGRPLDLERDGRAACVDSTRRACPPPSPPACRPSPQRRRP